MTFYFFSIKKGSVGGVSYNDLVQCSSYSLDSDEDSVMRSSPEIVGQVCSEFLTVEDSLNRSLLLGVPKGKSVSGFSGGLSCWYTNATSLNNKMDVFRAECVDTNYDVRFVSETWFNDQSIVNIDNYECFRRDRKSNTQGGGVCIYARNSDNISYRETNYDELNSSSIEQV